MIVRNCSGGIVFAGDKVLLVSNDKHEWGFPKGAVKSSADLSLSAFAKDRVKIETDVEARNTNEDDNESPDDILGMFGD